MNIRPIGERVIVELDEVEETTASGLIIPDAAKEAPHTGTVVAIGKVRTENNELKELETKIGDTVMFFPYAGTALKGYEGYRLIGIGELLGVIE